MAESDNTGRGANSATTSPKQRTNQKYQHSSIDDLILTDFATLSMD